MAEGAARGGLGSLPGAVGSNVWLAATNSSTAFAVEASTRPLEVRTSRR